ncbi:MAG: MarR family transcriptional regulator [Anaeroplasmataceae bacterium]|nr:MarR family transcriptional regulator [Anaeroplasmataceae bacterium]
MKEVGLEIKNLNNLISRNFKNLPSIKLLNEITGSNGYILSYLHHNENQIITQKSIEKTLGITRSTASTILSRMEKKELIVREILNNDCRKKQIKITEKGRSLVLQTETEIHLFDQKLISDFTLEEIELLFEMFRRIKKNVEGGNKI